MDDNASSRRRRARRGTSPVVWLAATAVAVVLSALGVWLATRGNDASPTPAAAVAKPRRPPPDCDAVRDATMRHLAKEGRDKSDASRFADATAASCRDDKWAPDVRRCLVDSERPEEQDACARKLSADQAARLAAAVETREPPSSVPPTRVDPACAAAADAYVKRFRAEAQKKLPADKLAQLEAYFAATGKHFVNAITGHCTEDKWPPAVVACVAELPPEDKFTRCTERLPEDHERRFTKAMNAALGGVKPIE